MEGKYAFPAGTKVKAVHAQTSCLLVTAGYHTVGGAHFTDRHE